MTSSSPTFNLEHDVVYGAAERLSPLVRRVTAKNPSRFTFMGTGTYIIGNGDVAIVDPGPVDDNHVDALVAAVDGETVTHLLITHTHGDHSPAASVLQTHFDCPTVGFGPHPIDRPDPASSQSAVSEADSHSGERTSMFGFDPLPDDDAPKAESDADGYKADHANDWDFTPDVVASHGEQIGGSSWTIESLHTPGHISNHLCFALAEEQALFSGDHVMGWSTTIIPPPDGNLNSYLDSLRLLLPRSEQIYYPTHGAPITDPQVLVPALLAHRENRTAQILDCMTDGIDTIKQMVLRMYTHVVPQLYDAAGASVMSHLRALHETGAIACSDTEPGPMSVYTLS